MVAREIAAALFGIGAVEIRTDPEAWFTWSSGARAPIYCDNRRILSFPEVRTKVAEGLAAAVRRRFPGVEVVAGAATGGIAHAAWVADRLALPMVYVRATAKEHGQGRQVEGGPVDGRSVVLIEDLVSFGGSAETAVRGLQDAGAKVIGVQAIVSYGFPEAAQRLEARGAPLEALLSYEDLIEAMCVDSEIDPVNLRALREWRAR